MTNDDLRLFAKPLRSDFLLRLWLAFTAVVAVTALVLNVELGGAYNPDRAADVLGTIIAGALLSFLLLAWLPALLRWVWRYGTEYPFDAPRRRTPSSWRPGAGSLQGSRRVPLRGPGAMRSGPPQWQAEADRHAERRNRQQWAEQGGTHVEREQEPQWGSGRSSWSTAAALRSDIGRQTFGHARWLEDDETAPAVAPADSYNRAPDISLSLDSQATVPGLPVELRWRADGAEYVTVEGIEQRLPARGSLALQLESSRDVVVHAFNQSGSSVARTDLIRVFPVPVLQAVRFPGMGAVSVNANVRVGVDWDEPLMQRLDHVLTRHQGLRAARFPPPDAPQLPASVISALRRLDRSVRQARGWRVGMAHQEAAVLPEPGVEPGWLRRLRLLMHWLWDRITSLLRRVSARWSHREPLTEGPRHDRMADADLETTGGAR